MHRNLRRKESLLYCVARLRPGYNLRLSGSLNHALKLRQTLESYLQIRLSKFWKSDSFGCLTLQCKNEIWVAESISSKFGCCVPLLMNKYWWIIDHWIWNLGVTFFNILREAVLKPKMADRFRYLTSKLPFSEKFCMPIFFLDRKVLCIFIIQLLEIHIWLPWFELTWAQEGGLPKTVPIVANVICWKGRFDG